MYRQNKVGNTYIDRHKYLQFIDRNNYQLRTQVRSYRLICDISEVIRHTYIIESMGYIQRMRDRERELMYLVLL